MLLFAVSCEKPEENSNSDNKTEDSNNSDNKTEEDIFFGLNKESIVISPEGGSVDILVYSNHKWEIKGGSDWCTPSVTCGNANENGEKVSFSAELTYDDRETIFWFCCADEKITFVVTQKLKETIIPDANNTFDIPAEGGVATLNYQTNVECKVVIPESANEWISVATASTRGLVDENIKLDIAENTTYSARTAVVKIVVSDNEEVYSEYIVNQKQNDGLIGDDDNITVSSIGGNVNLTYKTNVECKVIIPESAKDWITISPTTKTLNPQSTSLQISENNTYENRTAVVKVVAVSNDDLAIEYTINQEQNDAIIADDNRVFDVPFTGGDIRIDYQTNVDCKVVIPDDAKDWISIVPATRGLVNTSVTLHVSENDTYSARTAVVKVVKDGENNPVVEYTINQEQNDAIIADDAEVTINGWETSFTIQYKTNVECEVIISDDACEWLSLAPATKSLVNKSITFVADANNTGEERCANVKVVAKDNNKICTEYTITQNPRYLMEYMSNDGSVISPNKNDFGAIIISNTYNNGKGVIEFDSIPTKIGNYAFQYCSKLTSITIPNGVISIDKSAFYGCSSLANVTIASTVTSIGETAFYNCTKLTSIRLENEMRLIGASAFSNCSALESVTLGNNVSSIGGSAFIGCSSLTSITIPDNVTSIGTSVFKNCGALTTVVIGKGLTSIAGEMFYYCRNLATIEIGNGVTSIGHRAFSECDALTSVIIPDSVTSMDFQTFENCDALTDVVIGNNVRAIEDDTFSDCKSLTNIIIGNNVKTIGERAFWKCVSLTDITIPDNLSEIKLYAFKGCKNINRITLGKGLTYIGQSAFEDCSSLAEVHISDIAAWCKIEYGEWGTSHPLFNEGKLYLNKEIVTNIVLPENVTEIKSKAFFKCSTLESIVIPSTVSLIGNSAFYECSSLKDVEISSGVTSIGGSAFSGCSALTNVTIPDSVTSLGGSAFYNCSSLESIELPSNITSIGESTFYGCSKLSNIKIPNSVTSIGAKAFYSCSKLTDVTLPGDIISIGEFAFDDTVTDVNVIITDLATYCIQNKMSATYGLKHLFINNEEVTNLIIPEGVKEIGKNAFYKSSLESVNIPSSVTSIGESAFEESSSLKSVNLPNSVLSIGKRAFCNCKNLISVNIPQDITTIKELTFYKCAFESITIPQGVTKIEQYAFSSCSNLKNVYCKPMTPPQGGYNMFGSNASGRKIYVPAESLDKYKQSYSYWNDYASSIEGYNFENNVPVE